MSMIDQSETEKGQARRDRLLDGARAAFLANGFHATSMQDLFKATGTTPGAFYRYFPSKAVLVRALAGSAVGRLAEAITGTMGSEPKYVSDALMPAIFAIDEMERDNGGARLALMIWAEAPRDGETAHVIGEALRPMLKALDTLASALLKRGIVGGATYTPKDLAVILGGILQGYIVQRALFAIDPATYEMGLGAITHRHKV